MWKKAQTNDYAWEIFILYISWHTQSTLHTLFVGPGQWLTSSQFSNNSKTNIYFPGNLLLKASVRELHVLPSMFYYSSQTAWVGGGKGHPDLKKSIIVKQNTCLYTKICVFEIILSASLVYFSLVPKKHKKNILFCRHLFYLQSFLSQY